jgi:hypothetical protein
MNFQNDKNLQQKFNRNSYVQEKWTYLNIFTDRRLMKLIIIVDNVV